MKKETKELLGYMGFVIGIILLAIEIILIKNPSMIK